MVSKDLNLAREWSWTLHPSYTDMMKEVLDLPAADRNLASVGASLFKGVNDILEPGWFRFATLVRKFLYIDFPHR